MESMGRKLGPRPPYVLHLPAFLPTRFHPFYLKLLTGRRFLIFFRLCWVTVLKSWLNKAM